MHSGVSNSNGKLQSEMSAAFMKDRRADALGDLRVLPDEILCNILTTLTPRDVARLSCVSRIQLFLYRRLYRCYTSLNGFSFDNGNVERRENLSLEEFHKEYDGKKPVLINGLADNWPARKSWTSEQLLLKYPDTKFRISQRSSKKINMKFKDYSSYMQIQHDEDPLYIFDDKFGEAAPDLLKDYSVPHLFQEDYFAVLDADQRPPFRWLIIGPERSGASWHVDPGLTSAWNTLLCGRKRWALYPPGRVPLGVTVHVNEDDGDVSIETPTSLQWWLDFYPLLPDNDKPIECTQLPGETIYVPSGWWHCVLNLETTVAVTQNYVNSKNFEFVCLDMAPGYRHKGICRAGVLALDDGGFEDVEKNALDIESGSSYLELTRKEKRVKICQSQEDRNCENGTNGMCKGDGLGDLEYSYDINFLSMFLDNERDHYASLWNPSNCIGQREMRDWLWKLWVGRPGLRDLVWKGACLALNAGKWYERVREVCAFYEFPSPLHDEKLPVGTGSNPVYLIDDYAIKIFAEGGLEASLYGLGTELEFLNVLHNLNSSLKNYIPSVLASGIFFLKMDHIKYYLGMKRYPLIRRRPQFGFFFGEQLHNLHLLPVPCSSPNDTIQNVEEECMQPSLGNRFSENITDKIDHPPAERKLFISILNKQRKNVLSRLTEWGDPIPCKLIEKVDDYIPHDLTVLFDVFQNETEVGTSCTWIHTDVMDDNIYMTSCCPASLSEESISDPSQADSTHVKTCNNSTRQKHSWYPSHILDFSNLSIGEPILDIIPLFLDVFRGDSRLLKQFLESYRLPLLRKESLKESVENSRFGRLSYRAMCYCILHDENVLGAIFSLWTELRTATTWEEVEEKVWGDLNNYTESDPSLKRQGHSTAHTDRVLVLGGSAFAAIPSKLRPENLQMANSPPLLSFSHPNSNL
ncbi:UNVERIFIED_CONTAM: F-box protein [Sesamum calycinum]|uniref:F-box protein n=1 Tax=Sesamum calycinum TaxID=2727403 RepID=A0AAW2QLV0_9LAMI